MNAKNILQDFGLNEKETQVYLASLGLGDASLLQLSRKAKIKRTTAYSTVETLVQKGLLGMYQIRSGLRVRPQDPEVLKNQAEQRLRDIQIVLPELQQIQKITQHGPKVTYYKGRKGYQAVLEDTLKQYGSTVYVLGALTEHDKIITDEFDYGYYVPTRVKRNIRIQGLLFPSDIPKMGGRDHEKELRELRVLPEEYEFTAVKALYQNKVAVFSSTKEVICTVIESEPIAEMEKKMFEFAWERSVSSEDF